MELRHLLSISKSKFAIVHPDLLPRFLSAAYQDTNLSEKVFVFGNWDDPLAKGCRSWRLLLRHGEADWEAFDDEKRAKTTIAALLSTSGTTGLPKLAAISHYAHIAQNIMLFDSSKKPYEVWQLLTFSSDFVS